MSQSNEGVVKMLSTKPRNKELHDVLMSKKGGQHKKRNGKNAKRDLQDQLNARY